MQRQSRLRSSLTGNPESREAQRAILGGLVLSGSGQPTPVWLAPADVDAGIGNPFPGGSTEWSRWPWKSSPSTIIRSGWSPGRRQLIHQGVVFLRLQVAESPGAADPAFRRPACRPSRRRCLSSSWRFMPGCSGVAARAQHHLGLSSLLAAGLALLRLNSSSVFLPLPSNRAGRLSPGSAMHSFRLSPFSS